MRVAVLTRCRRIDNSEDNHLLYGNSDPRGSVKAPPFLQGTEQSGLVRFVVQQPKAVQLSVQLFSVSSEIGVHKIFSRCIVLLFSAESEILDF